MIVNNSKFLNFYVDKVQYGNEFYPIEKFSKVNMLQYILDEISNVFEKQKIIKICRMFYAPIANKFASKHHAGCRYAVKHRDKKDSEYKMYKKIISNCNKLEQEVQFEKNMMK